MADLEAREARLAAELADCRRRLLHARILAAVEAAPGCSSNAVVAAVPGDRSRVLRGLRELAAEGALVWSLGEHAARAWRAVRKERPVVLPVCGVNRNSKAGKVGA